MQFENRFAYKEWSVIIAGLAGGLQTLLLRKGGIAERRGGFCVEHNEFWLFPTYGHQRADALVPAAASLVEVACLPDPRCITISLYAVCDAVHFLREESSVRALAGLHLWSAQMVLERFHYRRPGLFVLLVRIHRLPRAVELPVSEHFAGCRSWFELPHPLSTNSLEPVLSKEEYQARRGELLRALRGPGLS